MHLKKIHIPERCTMYKRRTVVSKNGSLFTCVNNANSNCICKFASEKVAWTHVRHRPSELLNKMHRFIFAILDCCIKFYLHPENCGVLGKCVREIRRRRYVSFHIPSATFEFSIWIWKNSYRNCYFFYLYVVCTVIMYFHKKNIMENYQFQKKIILMCFCS